LAVSEGSVGILFDSGIAVTLYTLLAAAIALTTGPARRSWTSGNPRRRVSAPGRPAASPA
ncbi:hypothetical protein, partial [Streptomyces sp. NPDC057496]|uniref:hypothetical protein n=1 Tax=Streptomyces sp. NPDC057496 TaxID=3346149 RepID=UPI0036B63219